MFKHDVMMSFCLLTISHLFLMLNLLQISDVAMNDKLTKVINWLIMYHPQPMECSNEYNMHKEGQISLQSFQH